MLALWINKVGGLKIAWMIASNYIILAVDIMKFGIMKAFYGILNFLDMLQLGWQTVCTGIANFVGDLKTNVLMILQNMCNGAIDIINFFIEALNKIPGVSINAVEHVTFGTEAQIKNEAEKYITEDKFEYVCSNLYKYIPNIVKMFVNEDLFRQIVQMIYDNTRKIAHDILDDGRLNKSNK